MFFQYLVLGLAFLLLALVLEFTLVLRNTPSLISDYLLMAGKLEQLAKEFPHRSEKIALARVLFILTGSVLLWPLPLTLWLVLVYKGQTYTGYLYKQGKKDIVAYQELLAMREAAQRIREDHKRVMKDLAKKQIREGKLQAALKSKFHFNSRYGRH